MYPFLTQPFWEEISIQFKRFTVVMKWWNTMIGLWGFLYCLQAFLACVMSLDVTGISRNCVGMVWGLHVPLRGTYSTNKCTTPTFFSWWRSLWYSCAALCIVMADRSRLLALSVIVGCYLLALCQRMWMDGAYKSNQPKEIELKQCSILFCKQLNKN